MCSFNSFDKVFDLISRFDMYGQLEETFDFDHNKFFKCCFMFYYISLYLNIDELSRKE